MSSSFPCPEGGHFPGSHVLHRPTFTFGQVVRYHPPNTYLRPGGEPGETVTTWACELGTGDVLVWIPEAFEVLTTAELTILAGATSGVAALFKAIAEKSQAMGLPFARACELVGAALGMQLRMLEAASDAAATRIAKSVVGAGTEGGQSG